MAKAPTTKPAPAKPSKKAPSKTTPPAQLKPKITPKAQPKPKKSGDRRGAPKGKGIVAGRNGGTIGNPPHEPTRENRRIVETHAAVGTPHWLIAEEIGVSEDTLERHYRAELDRGLLRINARIGGKLAKAALDGCKTRQIFWMKTRAGWKERTAIELGGVNGAPIVHQIELDEDLSRLSREDLKVLKALRLKAGGSSDTPAS